MRLKPTPLLALAGAISLGWLSLAHADDTEIYVNPASTIRPNILFIIDTSARMNTLEAIDNPAPPNPSDGQPRLMAPARASRGVGFNRIASISWGWRSTYHA